MRVGTGTVGTVNEKSPLLFRCPSDSVVRTSSFTTGRSYTVIRANGKGIANSVIDSTVDALNYSPGRALSEIPAPAITLLVGEWPTDSNYFGNATGAGNLDRPIRNAPGGNNSQNKNVESLHFDGWNYLFADGHVKWLRPANTIDDNASDTCVGALTSNANATPQTLCGMWTISETD